MKLSTVEYIRNVLDAQKKYCETNPNDKVQRAYYDGMRAMFDIVVSDGFTKEG